MKPKYRCVIFDWDGTLADTIAELAGNVNRALTERGFAAFPVEGYLQTQGRPLEDHVLLALPPERRGEDLVRELTARALRFWEEAPLNLVRPYPGAAELLAALRNKRIKRAVLTNKPDPAARAEIARIYPPGAFDAISGVRPGAPCKPDPAAVWELLAELGESPGSVIFAGDSETDMQTAAAAGCLPLGVSWGYRDAETLLASGARRLINKPEELLELL
jgi:phosphoglycolate phosphatase